MCVHMYHIHMIVLCRKEQGYVNLMIAHQVKIWVTKSLGQSIRSKNSLESIESSCLEIPERRKKLAIEYMYKYLQWYLGYMFDALNFCKVYISDYITWYSNVQVSPYKKLIYLH